MGAQNGGNFWAFLASISPFESWRKYLVFRHRRDQDRRYREAAEARRLELENDARELALLEKRAKIAKQLGATKDQLAPLYGRILGWDSRPSVNLPPAAPTNTEPLLLTNGNGNRDAPPGEIIDADAEDGTL
jgi:hypothetical protein